MRKNEGFTLVELIVVIAIVAVLAGVLMLAINPAALLAKSRDAKRMEDLDVLNKAITLALAEREITLAAAGPNTSVAGTTAVDGTGWVEFTIPATMTGLSKYIASLPADPVNGACTDGTGAAATCAYTFASGALSTWEITTVMESADNVAKMTADGGNQTGAYEIGTDLTLVGTGGS